MVGSVSALKLRRVAAGTTGLVFGLFVLFASPFDGHATQEKLVQDVTAPVAGLVGDDSPSGVRLEDLTPKLVERLPAARLQEEDPKTEPPLHGTNPHGQGTVAVIDLNPSAERPYSDDPTGEESGEEVVVGRARGEQEEDGSYHGHITILALFGNEILGVDTGPGGTEHGPLNAVQEGLLTPLCDGSGEQICVSAVTADSTTTENGSSNRFSAAHVTLGGAEGIDAGAAESNGNISDDGTCQTAHGDSSVADANVGGNAVADVAQSSSDSKACKGQAPSQSNDSRVIALGGTGVPFPAAGCADGTPDVVTGIPTLAPVVCNADDSSGTQAEDPYGVRQALSVFVLEVGGSRLIGATTSGSESRAKAPPPQCSDTRDNDGDGVADADDPGCDSGPGGSYNPNDDDETDDRRPQCSDRADNDGDGVADSADPGCHTDGDATNDASFDPNDDDETNGPRDGKETDRDDRPECSDRDDNDGDGDVDRDDAGCLSGPGGTYDPNDDSEAEDRREAGTLPFTGSNTLLFVIAGLFLMGAGLDLRRRLAARATV